MPYSSPAAIVSGTVISKTTFGDVVKADLDFLANPPACRVYNNANISVNDATLTFLTFNSERYDTDSMHDTVTNTGRITINTAGLYIVTGTVGITAGNDYTVSYVTIRMNGTTHLAYQSCFDTSAGVSQVGAVTTIYKFAAADYVELGVFFDNTLNTARNVLSQGNNSPEFAATWIGLG